MVSSRWRSKITYFTVLYMCYIIMLIFRTSCGQILVPRLYASLLRGCVYFQMGAIFSPLYHNSFQKTENDPSSPRHLCIHPVLRYNCSYLTRTDLRPLVHIVRFGSYRKWARCSLLLPNGKEVVSAGYCGHIQVNSIFFNKDKRNNHC